MKSNILRYLAILLFTFSLSYIAPISVLAQEPVKPPVSKSKTTTKSKSKSTSTTKSKSTSTTKSKPEPKPEPPKVTIPEARTSGRTLDLQARRDGKVYYFNAQEWSALTPAQQQLFKPDGVLMKIGNEAFVVSLHDEMNEKGVNWDEAMLIYGNSLPTKAQGELLVKYKNILNEALKSYGGTIMDKWYWTCEEYDSSSAWYVYLYSGLVHYGTKTLAVRVRAVAPVPVASAM